MENSARLKEVWAKLDKQEHDQKLEAKHLSEVWLAVSDKHAANEQARADLEASKAAAGLNFVNPHMPVRLNVGGQRFETTAGVLCRDEYSILAGLCRGEGTTLNARLTMDEDAVRKFSVRFLHLCVP